MNELSLCQRPGRWHWSHCDVTPETQRREGALWDLPFIHLSLRSLCAHPPKVLVFCDRLILQAGDSPSPPPPLLRHPSPTWNAPWLSFPVQPNPVFRPAPFFRLQPYTVWLQPQKSQKPAHALAHRQKKVANLVRVCACLYVCQYNSLRSGADHLPEVGSGR